MTFWPCQCLERSYGLEPSFARRPELSSCPLRLRTLVIRGLFLDFLIETLAASQLSVGADADHPWKSGSHGQDRAVNCPNLGRLAHRGDRARAAQ
jgi:hypothetical protein